MCYSNEFETWQTSSFKRVVRGPVTFATYMTGCKTIAVFKNNQWFPYDGFNECDNII